MGGGLLLRAVEWSKRTVISIVRVMWNIYFKLPVMKSMFQCHCGGRYLNWSEHTGIVMWRAVSLSEESIGSGHSTIQKASLSIVGKIASPTDT